MKNIIITVILLAVTLSLVLGIVVPIAHETKTTGNNNVRLEIKNSGSQVEQLLGY